jgi:hypothetical protein
MGEPIYSFVIIMIASCIFQAGKCTGHTIQSGAHSTLASPVVSGVSYSEGNNPVITGLTYDNITLTCVSIYWFTDVPADSKINI